MKLNFIMEPYFIQIKKWRLFVVTIHFQIVYKKLFAQLYLACLALNQLCLDYSGQFSVDKTEGSLLAW